MLVTGVTLVCSDFLRENQAPVTELLEEHAQFVLFATGHVEEAAELITAQGVVEKAPTTQKALPCCDIVCLTGQEMKGALSGYSSTLMKRDPESVSGQLPGDDFYCIP